MRGKKVPAPPPSSGEDKTEAEGAPKKLKLSSLLHYLWYEGDLCKWIPQFQGKRSWWVVRGALRHAAGQTVAKKVPLATRLFVPETFNADRKDAIKDRRSIFFASLARKENGQTPLGVLVAEYKNHEQTTRGAKFKFKHMPDCSFFADEDLRKRFEAVFENQLALLEDREDCHGVVIATFSISPMGYPVLQEIALMMTNQNWIPFEHARDLELLEYITDQRRAFIKQMRFNLPPSTPIACAVLTDTKPQPTALFVTRGSETRETLELLETSLTEGTYPSWIWSADQSRPELPNVG